jgi:hypothetical protein
LTCIYYSIGLLAQTKFLRQYELFALLRTTFPFADDASIISPPPIYIPTWPTELLSSDLKKSKSPRLTLPRLEIFVQLDVFESPDAFSRRV